VEGVTIIIPARNEVYLQRTIEDIIKNARGEYEVIAICDGYWPDPPIKDHPNVNIIHHTEPRGQRQSINEAARVAKGKYIMKLDAHCALDEGFDVKLAADCEYDWTVIPRMYNLDHETWLPKLHKRTDYMFIGWNDKTELRSLYYKGDEWKKWHHREEEIDETMGCMGPCFFMYKDRFWELGGCDESHGSWGQQGIEVALKAWLSGGKLIVNKKTWFAHWFRGDVGFPYTITGHEVSVARRHSMDLWLNNKWEKQVRGFDWVLNKFQPPTWEDANYSKWNIGEVKMRTPIPEEKRTELQQFFYKNIHLAGKDPRWRGIKMIKMPTDIVLYQMAIWEKKPDFIVEIGTAYCASALMMADFCEMVGNGHVISIDPHPRGPLVEHPRITYLKGDSKSDEIIEQVKTIVGDGSVMLSIDGLHTRHQVKWELTKYKPIVTKGQFMVVEDCYGRQGELVGPGEARDWFLRRTKQFVLSDFDARFIFGFTKGGWLLKVV
jgi:cephalosporin hydroxylase/glycosyltransferase involved in cell wall biosynthesis